MAQRVTARRGAAGLATLRLRVGSSLGAQAEETRAGPMGTSDRAGNGGERAVAPVLIEEAVLQHDDAVGLAAPLTQQSGSRLQRRGGAQRGLAPLDEHVREGAPPSSPPLA